MDRFHDSSKFKNFRYGKTLMVSGFYVFLCGSFYGSLQYGRDVGQAQTGCGKIRVVVRRSQGAPQT